MLNNELNNNGGSQRRTNKMKTIKEATELIELGIKSMGADQHLTDQIKADVLKANDRGQCNFTKALDKSESHSKKFVR